MDEQQQRTTQRAAQICAGLSSFITPFMGSAVTVALPSIGHDLDLGPSGLTWVMTIYALAAAAALLPFGRLADLRGRKRLFVAGMIVDGLASLVCAAAPNSAWLLAGRLFQGAGGAMIFGTGVAILTSVFPDERRGHVLGINTAWVYIGLSVGPFLGGLITDQVGWRVLFLLGVVLAWFGAFIAATRLEGEWRSQCDEQMDKPGTVLYAVGLAALVLGFEYIRIPTGWGLLTGGLAALALFVWWEGRAPDPLLEIDLFRANRPFTFSNLAALTNYMATFGSTFLLSLYLQKFQHCTPQQAGTVLLVQPVMQAIFSPLAGKSSDRVEPRIVASLGMALCVAGLILLIPIGENTSLLSVIGCLTLLGIGFGLFSSPNMNAIMGSVERRLYGVASATAATMRLTGQMFSMGIVVLMLSLSGSAAQPEGSFLGFLPAARWSYMVFAVMCSFGIIMSLARGRVREACPPVNGTITPAAEPRLPRAVSQPGD